MVPFDGHRYDLRPDKHEYEITSYEEFVIRAPLRTMLEEEGKQKTRPTSELFGSTDLHDRAELQWRLAMPVSALILAVLAIPLSRVDPRQGKYARLLFAILLYTLYRQLLSTSKNWVAGGDLSTFPGMWTVHFICFVMAMFFYVRGAENTSPLVVWLRTLRPPSPRSMGRTPRNIER